MKKCFDDIKSSPIMITFIIFVLLIVYLCSLQEKNENIKKELNAGQHTTQKSHNQNNFRD